MPNWRSMGATLEAAVDGMYGEQIQLQPYKAAEYMTAPQVDSSRPVVGGVGVVYGKATMVRAGGSAEFLSKRAEADLLISVQDKYLTSTQQGDRIKLLDPERNNQVCEISFIEWGTNGRSLLHLLKNKVT